MPNSGTPPSFGRGIECPTHCASAVNVALSPSLNDKLKMLKQQLAKL